MSIVKILNSLEISWKREEILTKIKNGESADEIVDEFFINNKELIEELNTLLRPEDVYLLNKVETLSTCEAKLINKISNLNYLEKKYENSKISEKKNFQSNKVSPNKFFSFMVNWSNKIVIISLLTISAIALSKQAWA